MQDPIPLQKELLANLLIEFYRSHHLSTSFSDAIRRIERQSPHLLRVIAALTRSCIRSHDAYFIDALPFDWTLSQLSALNLLAPQDNKYGIPPTNDFLLRSVLWCPNCLKVGNYVSKDFSSLVSHHPDTDASLFRGIRTHQCWRKMAVNQSSEKLIRVGIPRIHGLSMVTVDPFTSTRDKKTGDLLHLMTYCGRKRVAGSKVCNIAASLREDIIGRFFLFFIFLFIFFVCSFFFSFKKKK